MGCCGHIINDVIPYVNNAMLAAILSLLIVILFVLLLHVYARWLLGQAHHRRTRASFSMTQVFGPPRRLAQSTTTTYTYDVTSIITKGLDRTAVDSIPIFVYGQDEGVELECAICLSLFEEREIGRSLPRCSHAFHVGCIDMWLHSHSTCPVCRAQVVHHDHHNHHRTVEIEDGDDNHDHHGDDDHDRGESMVEIVVENHDDK